MRLLPLSEAPHPADAEKELSRLLGQTFSFPEESWEPYVQQVGRENFRVLLDDRARVVAGLGVYRPGQWFGGRSIPMGAIAAVGVQPELRGSGIAFELMSGILRELHATGVPLSALYASTSRLYRKVGYEHAGSACIYETSTQDLGNPSEGDPLQAVDPQEHDRFRDIYQTAARLSNGWLDRTPGMWTRISRKQAGTTHAYLSGGRHPSGYIIYEQREDDAGKRKVLSVRDWIALTPGARRGILKLLAGHRSLESAVRWRGPFVDPWISLFPEQRTRGISIERWLLRITDVVAALNARGYPPELNESLDLTVVDETISENSGQYHLEVSQGRGRVTAGGSGGLTLSVRALAPLYSGFHRSEELASLGWIEGDERSLQAAARIFAGPEPWMPDGF